jgi:hypothetical protein
MITNYIDFKIFLISLAIGLFFVYINQSESTIIYVYPTPDNINNIQYKDHIGNCFEFDAKEVTCPEDKTKIHTIPIQEGN